MDEPSDDGTGGDAPRFDEAEFAAVVAELEALLEGRSLMFGTENLTLPEAYEVGVHRVLHAFRQAELARAARKKEDPPLS